jgi:hypothetical protein
MINIQMLAFSGPLQNLLSRLPCFALYIDPGTGSMLFTILLAVIGTSYYSLRMLFLKLRFRLSSGKVEVSGDMLDFVIFSDDKRYWSVFKPICTEMARRGRKVHYFTADTEDPVLSYENELVDAEFIGAGDKAYARLNLLQAKVVLATTPGLDVYQWRRSPKVKYYVHLPHAASEVLLYRMFGLDYYDAVLLSGEFQATDTRALEQLRHLPPKNLHLVGIPYMDEMKNRLLQAPPLPAKPRTVLLAPSWGQSAIFGVYGGSIIARLQATGCHVIVRPHPHSFIAESELMAELMSEYPESEQLEWNRDQDNFDVLRRADLLISDFSGVVFDFALVYDKPVIYTNPNIDLSVYDAWWLKKPLWTTTALPRLGLELSESNLSQLDSLIEQALEDPGFAAGREEVRQECWVFPGEGARRSVDFLLDKIDEFTDKVEEEDRKAAPCLLENF